MGPGGYRPSLMRSVMGTAANALPIGQFSIVDRAIDSSSDASILGTVASASRSMPVIENPSYKVCLSVKTYVRS